MPASLLSLLANNFLFHLWSWLSPSCCWRPDDFSGLQICLLLVCIYFFLEGQVLLPIFLHDYGLLTCLLAPTGQGRTCSASNQLRLVDFHLFVIYPGIMISVSDQSSTGQRFEDLQCVSAKATSTSCGASTWYVAGQFERCFTQVSLTFIAIVDHLCRRKPVLHLQVESAHFGWPTHSRLAQGTFVNSEWRALALWQHISHKMPSTFICTYFVDTYIVLVCGRCKWH